MSVDTTTQAAASSTRQRSPSSPSTHRVADSRAPQAVRAQRLELPSGRSCSPIGIVARHLADRRSGRVEAEYVLPSPPQSSTVSGRRSSATTADRSRLWEQLGLTMQRGLIGLRARDRRSAPCSASPSSSGACMRLAIGSLIAGLQTMPSIAWFPLAILFFGLTEKAILFVVVLGAAPSIAAGVITGYRRGAATAAAGGQDDRRDGNQPLPLHRAAGRDAVLPARVSSRAGRSPGEACSQVSCWSRSAARRRWARRCSSHARSQRRAVAARADDRDLDHRHGDRRDLRILHPPDPREARSDRPHLIHLDPAAPTGRRTHGRCHHRAACAS